MIIELTKEFIDELTAETDESKQRKAITIINSAFYHMYHHHHIVCCSSESVDILLRFLDGMSGFEVKASLTWIKNNILDVFALREKASFVIILSFGKTQIIEETKTERTIKKYYISIFDTEEIKESTLMCENKSDYDFYRSIFRWDTSPGCDSFLENRPFGGGGGEAIKPTYEEKRAVLVIVDSDKDFSEGKIGSTAKGVRDKLKEINKSIVFPIEAYSPDVREKENLFLYDEYSSLESDSKTKNVLNLLSKESNEEILRFFDIKDGIKRKKLKDEQWVEKYKLFLDDCINNDAIIELKECDGCEDDCCAKKCNHKEENYIRGIGGDLLERAAGVFFEKSTKKPFLETDLHKLFRNQRFIIDEWETISEKIFSYGCCIKSEEKFLR